MSSLQGEFATLLTAPAKILIVDDDLINIRMLDGILHDHYDIMVAVNGEQALKRALLVQPDLILLDIGLGDLSGYDVFKYLAANEITRDIPVMFVTAHASEEEEQQGLALGAVDYVTKPYRPAIVQARIKNHIELKRQRDLLTLLTAQDSLTGLANKHGFDLFLEQAWHTAIRYQEAIAVISASIDDFKQYNDQYGHIVGNKSIKKVADVLAKNLLRKTDLLARYHEQQFICVLTKTDLQGAYYVAHKIQAALKDKAIPHHYSDVDQNMTLSLGVMAMHPHFYPSDRSVLIDSVTRLMHAAQTLGGNRILQKTYLPPRQH